MRREFVLSLVWACVPLAVADAATIVVKQGGAISTIQSGINAAVAGDTVLVMPGVYQETPLIIASKSGLVVRGKGKVIVDARDPDGTADGAAFNVQADDVTLERMTIRHASFEVTDGHGVLANADGLTLRDLTIVNCSHYGVRVFGNDLVMSKCTVRQGLGGVNFVGTQATIESCTFSNLELRGLDIDGAQLTVRKNVLRDCSSDGILAINATSSVFASNVVDTVGGTGIVLAGTSITVEKNSVRCCDAGIDVAGTSAFIRSNTVRDTQGRGIEVDGLSSYLLKNKVERAIGQGILVLGDSAVFESNVALRCGDFGIGLSGNSALFVKNTVLDCCVGGENGGISALGASIALEKNVARRCGDGIRVNGNSAFLSGNVASQNAVDGFEIAGGSTIALSGNVAIGNGAEGIDNEGTSTALIGNVCKGNRIDITSANAPLQFENNVYVTGGPNVAPEVD